MHIGRADASAAFTVAVWWITSWIVGLFPDETQDEVFADPHVRVCGTLAPTGTAVRAKDGGIVVNGRWGFNSGAQHSQWKVMSGVVTDAENGPEPFMAVVPVADMINLDDWYVSGLESSGSVTLVAEDLYVPRTRWIPIAPLLTENYPTKKNAGVPIYRTPMIPAASASTVGKIVGIMRGAYEAFFERVPGRGITYTGYLDQREAPLTHLQVAKAALKTDEAEYHAFRLCDLVDRKNLSGEPWTLQERAYARVAMGRACQLAKESIDILNTASGGSSVFRSVPIQRWERDIEVICLHALNPPDTNTELYGRVLCGLESDSPYI